MMPPTRSGRNDLLIDCSMLNGTSSQDKSTCAILHWTTTGSGSWGWQMNSLLWQMNSLLLHKPTKRVTCYIKNITTQPSTKVQPMCLTYLMLSHNAYSDIIIWKVHVPSSLPSGPTWRPWVCSLQLSSSCAIFCAISFNLDSIIEIVPSSSILNFFSMLQKNLTQ